MVAERERGGGGGAGGAGAAGGERWAERGEPPARDGRGSRGASEEPRAADWGRMGRQPAPAPRQPPAPRRNFEDMPPSRPGTHCDMYPTIYLPPPDYVIVLTVGTANKQAILYPL